MQVKRAPTDAREPIFGCDEASRGRRATALYQNATRSSCALVPAVMGPIGRVTREMFGVPVVPFMSTGATDGRFLRSAGIPTYGVSGLFGDPNDVRAHGRDERMLVKSFYEGLEFLDRLVRRMAGVDDVSP